MAIGQVLSTSNTWNAWAQELQELKGVVVVKTLVKTLWFFKRLVYHMKDILLWNKGSPYLHRKALKCVKVEQAFPTKGGDEGRSFLCGKVASLWLTISSHNSHNTLTNLTLIWHITKPLQTWHYIPQNLWMQRISGLLLTRQTNQTAYMPHVKASHETGF